MSPQSPALHRYALEGSSWVEHEESWLGQEEAQALFEDLRATLRWEQRDIQLFGRRIPQPRLIAWAGELPYRYSGQTLPPRPFTASLEACRSRVVERVGVAFNHVLLNRYRDGKDSMGQHSDDEPELGERPVVASVSLGAERRFVVRTRRRRGGKPLTLALGHGSLLVMGGACQHHYRHGIPRQAGCGERISLTFRRLLRAPVA